MNTPTEAPAAPDLSSLTKRQQLNVKVAQTQGAFWVRMDEEPEYARAWQVDRSGDPWALEWPGGGYALWTFSGQSLAWMDLNSSPARYLPDYAGDPSAWGALMEKEGVWPEPVYDYPSEIPVFTGWMGRWVEETESDWCAAVTSVDCSSVGLAVCVAVLNKYGVDPSPYIGD